MKHFFLKQIQAFISHKRINGQASPEAILVKNALDTDATFNASWIGTNCPAALNAMTTS